MSMQNLGHRKRVPDRPRKPYIQATSAEFLRILPAARAELEAAELRPDGKPRFGGGINLAGRPKGAKNVIPAGAARCTATATNQKTGLRARCSRRRRDGHELCGQHLTIAQRAKETR